ncbi:hypothetical protein [Mycolicibacterium mucogenicum]|uniref:hypothetical protein n=1 Tax=Mycolicibacterium mucogenicum TaxID=56689 RepID=UPI000A81347B|nr:hypothetical protein [Mycolicibacterium mucogenicum]KAB7753686.1 hypothetical protein MMUC44124_24190 [Mycolicibacterium mucogenicum DSM 44124]
MTAAQKFRKEPVEIDAMQWDGTAAGATPIIDWILANGGTARFHAEYTDDSGAVLPAYLSIDTLEGSMAATLGDWIIRGVKGEFYPCKPDIFSVTYAAVQTPEPLLLDPGPGLPPTRDDLIAICRDGFVPAGYRSHPLSSPLGAITGQPAQGLLFSGWFKQHGSQPHQFPAPHPLSDPFGAITGHDTTSLLTAEWHAMLADLTLEDCYFRMLGPHEIGRGCGFDVDFADHKGTFIVWGSNRDQVDGYGNAVSPAVGEWISARLRDALHGEVAA